MLNKFKKLSLRLSRLTVSGHNQTQQQLSVPFSSHSFLRSVMEMSGIQIDVLLINPHAHTYTHTQRQYSTCIHTLGYHATRRQYTYTGVTKGLNNNWQWQWSYICLLHANKMAKLSQRNNLSIFAAEFKSRIIYRTLQLLSLNCDQSKSM